MHVNAGDAPTEVECPQDCSELLDAEALEWCWHVHTPNWMAMRASVSHTTRCCHQPWRQLVLKVEDKPLNLLSCAPPRQSI
jgi:uncharacterized protein YmfQ (DUF2313 family)